MKNILLSAFIALVAAVSIDAQQMTGQVLEIVDQKTFSLQTSNAKFTVQLQYVDPPEASQPLHDVVKNHLTTMLKGKTVTVQFASLSGGRTIGKVYLSGVDVSMQLLRDGAAWYSVPEAKLQPAADRSEYEQAESLARSEKRGVWGLQNVKPAWELRVERVRLAKELEEKEFAEFIKKLAEVRTLAQAPYAGMSLPEFNYLCGSEQGDETKTDTMDSGNVYISKRLVATESRRQKKCNGSFNFNPSRRLEMVSQTVVTQ